MSGWLAKDVHPVATAPLQSAHPDRIESAVEVMVVTAPRLADEPIVFEKPEIDVTITAPEPWSGPSKADLGS